MATRPLSPGNWQLFSCYTALNFGGSRAHVLLELRVENYAVIDNVAVEFAPGLNLLTGETGAGKSILIDALALLLGDKASTDTIRHGTERAVVSAVYNGHFESTCYHPLLLFNGEGDCLAGKLRPGNVHSAEDWAELLLPE